ncbi:DUF1152 domain-containing protein [Bradyrhizobium sp. CCGUVB23]|uniref:DUF1152 domain-containing protein n=1 Tax=Bradyrhizobium sp. CCGUVB23 TaxID=2949630 RepID=UPI0020B1AA2A|nr:DUF1152 domain-containing protein [Bradyrhizobium sp. CCGUVB23]MCP3465055.1 DUF1152 domain-containing protein [Bradyrhizobium sp. CCGUVB23]
MVPFLERLDGASNMLVAGCGGGFDVFAGMPLAQHLMVRGKRVVFASLSFTNLWLCGGERVGETTWRVDQQAADIPYFPENWLAEWLSRRDQLLRIYAFAKSGVRPLAAAYRAIMDHHDIDTVVLVDGGTDSILFGDEPGLGTVVEDAVSIVAADQAAGERVLLAAIGFGVDHYHGVSHHAFLENVSQLIRDGGFLGMFSLSRGNAEADAFLDLVDYANQRQPQHQSIVCNSIASALRGEFGNYHATNRTSGNELFINPLMAQYWTFQSAAVVRHMAYASELAETARVEEVRRIIDLHRETSELRPFRPIPL